MNNSTLKDVSELITKGTTPSSVGCEFVSEGINFIKSESISDSKYLNNSIYEHIDIETDKKLKRSRIKEGDLLFSIAGAYLGKVAIVQAKDVPANTNQAVGIVRLKKDIVDVDYVYYYFSQRNINTYINKLSSQSSQPNLNLDLLGKLEFELKDIDEQRKIASILSALDSKIELNNRINLELEAMAKTIYDYWFVQFDFLDKNGKPYKSSGGKMIWNEELKSEIPEGWQSVNLRDLLVFEKGIEPGSSEYLDFKLNKDCINFIRVGDIDGSSSIYIDSSQNNCIKVGITDIVVTFDGSVGKLGFGLEGAISGGLRKIYDKSGLLKSSLIYFLFRDKRIISTIHKYATGSILLHASSSIEHLVIAYDEGTYSKFQELAAPYFDKMVLNKNENQQLASLRDWLLPMLMNGQVKVN